MKRLRLTLTFSFIHKLVTDINYEWHIIECICSWLIVFLKIFFCNCRQSLDRIMDLVVIQLVIQLHWKYLLTNDPCLADYKLNDIKPSFVHVYFSCVMVYFVTSWRNDICSNTLLYHATLDCSIPWNWILLPNNRVQGYVKDNICNSCPSQKIF